MKQPILVRAIRLDKRQQNDAMRLPRFLRTHPYNAERYEAVSHIARRLQATEPDAKLYVGRANLRARTPRQEKQFPD